MGNLFGTDGIRGVANEHPITAEMALRLGKASARMFGKNGRNVSVVVGKDPRVSGDMLAFAFISGICSMGADAYFAGILPTPAVAFLATMTTSSGGVMVSASHNPFYDNGIKFFGRNGYKLNLADENEIEYLLDHETADAYPKRASQEVGRVHPLAHAEELYLNFLKKSIPEELSLKGMKIVLDCSNGATYQVAPRIFAELGATVKSLFIEPDGKNINDHCGSQFPEKLQSAVMQTGSDIGLAFDGDGDRLIAVDEKGKTITGDQILVICAKYLKQRGLLKNNRVVSTVMSNLGLKIALKTMGIEHLNADVGDRQVMEKMIEAKAILGGEDSGHTIFLNHHTTGDGILTALKLIEAMHHESQPLSHLAELMDIFPQTLVNIRVKRKTDLHECPDIQQAIDSIEQKLGEKGRVLVRYSGTRPLCRVMVEGPTREQTQTYAQEIADVISKQVGE
jgi:phosphoglucosamine mutase